MNQISPHRPLHRSRSNVMLAGWFATGGGGLLFLPSVTGDPYVYQEVGSEG